ncbi:MAG: hypothetical protein ACLT98_17815 [Eggerthellaceae bacterium]
MRKAVGRSSPCSRTATRQPPPFTEAGAPDGGNRCRMVRRTRRDVPRVETGASALTDVSLTNDGPFTLWLDTDALYATMRRCSGALSLNSALPTRPLEADQHVSSPTSGRFTIMPFRPTARVVTSASLMPASSRASRCARGTACRRC